MSVFAAFWKAKERVLVRVFMPILMGVGVALLSAPGSAQTLDIPAWQEAVKNAPPSGGGCFEASYPDMQWQPVACNPGPTPDSIPLELMQQAQTGAGSSGRADLLATQLGSQTGAITSFGYAAGAVGGPISSAEGSLISVTGVASISDNNISPYSNTYSLQLNSDYFAVPQGSSFCTQSGGCQGWVQFVYQNYGTTNGLFSIWYWLIGSAGMTCPASWTYFSYSGHGSCFYASQSPTISGQPITNFNNQISLRGQTANGTDTAILTIGGKAYTTTNASAIPSLPQLWQQAQFNVFGLGSYSTASLNSGSSLIINTKIDNGTTNAPNCPANTNTGESNNLNYNSPCCAYSGGKPSIAFVEGTSTGMTVSSCSALGDNTITPAITPSSGGTISPSVALHVPNSAVSTFTITPNSGYTISSVTGCGGSLSGNTFTTAPASASCTVTATFASTMSGYTVTASAGTGGGISPSGAVSVNSGSSQAFTLTPNSGYSISSVGGTCGGTLNGNTYTTNAITANCTVTAAFASQPTYIVTASAGTGGSISPSGYLTVNSGAAQTFTVTPNSGYSISSMGGTCGGTLSGNTYTTKAITAGCTVTAAFAQTTYTVTASAGTGGNIGPSGAVSVTGGSSRTFTVTPNSGYSISSVGGTCGGTLTGNTYTTNAITANCTITAVFSQVTYTVTASAGTGGNIGPSGAVSVTGGSSRTFTVTPNSGYSISSVGGTCGGTLTGNTYTTNAITANCTITAVFSQVTYTVTASAGTGGSISPSGAVSVTGGSTRAFTVTPNSGYSISSMGGTCGGTLSGNTYTTNAITANCTVTAVFSQVTYTVTVSVGTGGSISPSGAVSVTGGSTRAFTVTPNSGYGISSVGGTCGGTLSGNTYTTNAITANCTVTAAFTSTAVTAGPTVTLTQITPSGTSSPAVGTAVSVSSNGSTTFTITPPAGTTYAVWNWNGGCGSIALASTWYMGSTMPLKVGPVTSNCTFTVTFTVTNPTVTLTQVAPSGASSPAVGTAVSVSPNGSTTFTVTPPAGVSNAAWNWNGGCGAISLASTWYLGSSLALKVGPVTSNCTFTVTFTTTNSTVTLTKITPSGTSSPAVGTAVSVSPNGSTTFTITPPAGANYASWAGWSGGCGAISLASTWYIGSSLILKVGPVTSNCTFPVVFSSS